MANKKKSARSLWTKAPWRGFVNVKISNQEKKYIKDNLLGEEGAFQFLMDAAADGYKCSVSYSIPEDVYTTSLTGQYLEKPNAGITMSIRHKELVVALSALYFCSQEDGKVSEWSDRYSVIGDDDW